MLFLIILTSILIIQGRLKHTERTVGELRKSSDTMLETVQRLIGRGRDPARLPYLRRKHP